MFIKSVKLTNIRSYLNEEVIFPEGSVLLSGDIGSGKSSILLAIEFALFGIRTSELPGSLLLRNDKSSGSVELKFEIEGKEVVVKRMLKKVKNDVRQDTGYIIVNGIKKEGTAVELKSMILDLLGYPKELLTKSKNLIYRYTVYTPQEEMKQILLEEEEQRLDILRKVFAIDKYKRIRDNTALFIRLLKEKKRELEGRIADLEAKKSEKDRYEQELKNIEKGLEELYPLLENIRNELNGKRERIAKLEQGIKELNSLKRDEEVNNSKVKEKEARIRKGMQGLTELKEQLGSIKKRLEGFKIELSEEELEKELNTKERELSEFRQEKTILSERIAAVNKKLEELKEELKEKINIKNELKEKGLLHTQLSGDVANKKEINLNIEKLDKNLESLNRKIKELEVKKENSEEIINNISSVDKCPVCYQDVPAKHKERIKEIEGKRINELGEQLLSCKKEKEQAMKALERLKEQREELHLKERELERIKAQINHLDERSNKINEKEAILSRLGKERIEYINALDKLNRINLEEKDRDITHLKQKLKDARERKHLNELLNDKENSITRLVNEQEILEKEISSLKKELEEIKRRLNEIGDIEKDYNSLRRELEVTLARERDLEIKIAGMDKEKQGTTNIIKNLEKEIAVKLGYKENLNGLGSLQGWLEEYFVKLMEVIEKSVMVRVNKEFNELFTGWFNTLMESETLNARLDDRFSPVIEQDGYEVGINNLSGGEKTSLALAYRLALNKVINDLITGIKTKDIIVLDEPTDGFSTEQLDKVRAVLEQLNIKQVIIVSHESKIESFVNNIIRINKEGNVSKVAADV